MVRDLICSMEVDETKAGVASNWEGQTYYFCAPACKDQFIDLMSPEANSLRGNREGAPTLGDD